MEIAFSSMTTPQLLAPSNQLAAVRVPKPLLPYPAAHLLINFVGKLPGGEEWSIGFRTEAASPPLDQIQIYANYAAQIFEKFWNQDLSPKVDNPIQVTMDTCTVRAIDVNGKTTAQAVGLPLAPVTGALGAPTMPNQCALVVSLLTARSGRSYRGRVYLPILGAGVLSPAGRLDPAGAAVYHALTFVGYLIASLNGQIFAPAVTAPQPVTFFHIAIQSRASGQPGAPVTSIKVGDVIDTQRRRRDKLVENYRNEILPTTV